MPFKSSCQRLHVTTFIPIVMVWTNSKINDVYWFNEVYVSGGSSVHGLRLCRPATSARLRRGQDDHSCRLSWATSFPGCFIGYPA